MSSMPKSLMLCLCAALGACSPDPTSQPDPRYLYRPAPGPNANIRNQGLYQNGPRDNGALYNEKGERVDANMPGYTSNDMPSEHGADLIPVTGSGVLPH